jgi:hypothetical protein
MNKFDERKKSFEKKFANDQEIQFKIESKANKYLAEWASLKLEKNDKDKDLYIQEVIKADMEEPGKDDVLRKIKKDFEAASLKIEDKEIREQIEKALFRAKEDYK